MSQFLLFGELHEKSLNCQIYCQFVFKINNIYMFVALHNMNSWEMCIIVMKILLPCKNTWFLIIDFIFFMQNIISLFT